MPRPVPVPGEITSTSGVSGILHNGYVFWSHTLTTLCSRLSCSASTEVGSCRPCVAGFVAFVIAQSLKVLTHWYAEAKWDFTQVMRSGGMPSSHTSCVSLALQLRIMNPFYSVSLSLN